MAIEEQDIGKENGNTDEGVEIPSTPFSPFCIGTPGNPTAAMMRSLMALVKPPGTPFMDAKMSQPGRDKLNIADARNALVNDFLTAHENPKWNIAQPLQWLLQVDGDAVLHPMTLQRLQSWNRACVGALCVTRYKPYQPVCYRGICKDIGPDMRSYYIQWEEVLDWCKAHPEIVQPAGPAWLPEPPEDSLHQYDWTGSHCFLINRSVFEAIEPPWFEMASKIKWGSGSDRLFFEKVAAAGFEVNVDFSIVAGHAAEVTLGMADFLAFLSITQYIEEDGGPDGESVFCGDDWAKRQPEPGADSEPASAGVRLARTLDVADRMGLQEGD